jgi:hypothetical protein
MANIDSIEAFAQGKQRFGYLKNDYFLVSGVLYYKSIHWPVAKWNIPEHPAVNPDRDIAFINTEKRGQEDVASYVLQELQRRDVDCRTVGLEEINA